MAGEFVMGARLNLGVSQYVSQVKSASKMTQDFKNSANQADKSAKTWRSSQGQLRGELGSYTRAADQATKETREFSNETRGLKSTLGGLKGLVATAFAGFGVKKGYDWLVGANADMETYKNTLTVVMKSSEKAEKTLAWAEKFSATTPFEIPQVIEATTRLSAYGLEAQKVLGITGDMASVMGKDLMQAVEAVADAQTGELERLKEFGITKGMIEDSAKSLGLDVINNKGQITDFKGFNTALFKLMEDRYSGGMAMQSKTWKGMLSNAQDFMGSLGRQLGMPIFEAAKGQLSNFLDYLNKLQESGAIQQWVDQVSTAVIKAGAYISNTVTYIKENWGTIAPAVAGVTAAFVAFTTASKIAATASKVMAVKTAIMGAVAKAGSVKMALLNAVMALNPVTIAVAAIGALIGVLVYAAMRSEAFRTVLLNTWNSIVTFVTPAIDIIKNAVMNGFSAILQWTNQYWPKIQSIISFVWSFLGPFIGTWLEFIKTLISNSFTIIVTLVKGAWDMVVAVITTAWTVISNIVGFWLNLLTGDFKAAGTNVINIFKGMGQGIVDFFGAFGSTMWNSGVKIMETLADGIKSAVMAPVNAVKGVFGKVRELMPFSDAKKGPFSSLTMNGGKIISTMAEGVKAKTSSLHNAIYDAFNTTPVMTATGSFDAVANPISYSAADRVNPAGGAPQQAGQSKVIHIAKLIEKLELHDVGDKDPKALVKEFISALYDELSEAKDIAASADMGAVL